MECSTCGAQRKGNSAFCVSCGELFAKESEDREQLSVCRHCSKTINSDAKFCGGCGGEQGEDVLPANGESGKKKRINKKTAAALIIPFLFVSAGAGTYYYVSDYYSSPAYLASFHEAVEAADKEYFVEASSNSLADRHAEALIDYFDDDADLFADFERESLEVLAGGEYVSQWPVHVKPGADKFYFFQDHELEYQPYEIHITGTHAGTEVYLNGQDMGVLDSASTRIELVNLPYENFVIDIIYDGAEGAYEEQYELNAAEWDGYFYEIHSEYQGEFITLSAEEMGSSLYVNNEYVGTYEGEELEYGPVAFDGSMEVYGEWETLWGTERSAPQVITAEETHYQAEFDTDEEALRDLMFDAVNDHASQYIEAYNQLDESKFTMVHTSYEDEYFDRVEKNFADQRSEGWFYTGELTSVVLDEGSFNLIETGDSYAGEIDVEMNFYSGYHKEGRSRGTAGKSNSSAQWTYHVIYEDDTWWIAGQEEIEDWKPESVEERIY
ncbi:TcaA 3rd/4th domain-containing protein [Alkalicoccus daliensis]|uniref:Uncharacterized membrane protein YvbJ n=1 Tax=Alkalicoccus daliensis TaxID=745820 RepID=A0A1H0GBI6_9BACI|nr:hypothetical protein [Alkalicoccus daliensis]SDO04267.1 Uncharacterized membrane protein YvbJ [Alkalicoccus daliensis]